MRNPPKEAGAIFLRPVHNIGLDIGKRYAVLLVVEKGGANTMHKKRLTTNGNVFSPHRWPLAKCHLVL